MSESEIVFGISVLPRTIVPTVLLMRAQKRCRWKARADVPHPRTRTVVLPNVGSVRSNLDRAAPQTFLTRTETRTQGTASHHDVSDFERSIAKPQIATSSRHES